LAGVRSNGGLFVLWRHNTESWRFVDVTNITGERIEERPASYQLADGEENVELLGGRSSDGHTIVYWWKPSRDWQAIDLTDINCQTITTPPEAWLTDSGAGRVSEHLAAIDSRGNLVIFYSYDQPRTLTDQMGEIYDNVNRMRNSRRKVLTILWDPHYSNIPKPDKNDIIAALFGWNNSMRDYFRENSHGTFTIDNMGVLGMMPISPLSITIMPIIRMTRQGQLL